MKFLPKEEQAIINVKYAAKRFGLMDADEVTLSAHEMLLKIHTITGWVLPTDTYLKILADQLTKKLQESYSNLNIEEVEYAFRNRGIDLKDWGREINLTIIDEVLIPYLESRAELSKVEEQAKKPKQIERSKELTDEEWEEWIVDIKKYPLELIPINCYEYLLRTGKINPTTEEKKEYMNKSMPLYAISIQENLRMWNEFIKMKNDNKITGDHFDSLVVFSKRLIVQDYFKSQEQCLTT